MTVDDYVKTRQGGGMSFVLTRSNLGVTAKEFQADAVPYVEHRGGSGFTVDRVTSYNGLYDIVYCTRTA